MTIFAVYQANDPSEAPEAVPDRFSWFAFLLPPVWAVAHGLWLELLGFLALCVLTSIIGRFAGDEAAILVYLALALLIGFEAAAIRGAALKRQGFGHRADLVSSHADVAAVRYLERGDAA